MNGRETYQGLLVVSLTFQKMSDDRVWQTKHMKFLDGDLPKQETTKQNIHGLDFISERNDSGSGIVAVANAGPSGRYPVEEHTCIRGALQCRLETATRSMLCTLWREVRSNGLPPRLMPFVEARMGCLMFVLVLIGWDSRT